MFPRPSDRTLVFATLAGATVIVVAACGGGNAQSPSPTAASEATVTATATETATATATATETESTGTGGTPTCQAAKLKIAYTDDPGGAGAGSVQGTFRVTNAGSGTCVLRGFPGVSYVKSEQGDPIGQPATRTDDTVKTVTLALGKTAMVALRRTQPQNYGDACQSTKAIGFRFYPPGNTDSAFISFDTTACKSSDAPLLQVGPVR